jgi:tetratricopeptide (TPR) repeat protein
MKRSLHFLVLFFTALHGASAQSTTLSGKVATADGSPLPPRVAIQRQCGASPQTVAYTDRRGQFSFHWAVSEELIPDASETGGRIPIGSGADPAVTSARTLPGATGELMSGCTLRASAPGYRSDEIPLDSQKTHFENYNLGTITLKPTGSSGVQTVSATSSKAPSDARKAFDRGVEAVGKGKPADAEKDFEKAVAIYPQYADAWLNLGKLRLQRKADDAAAEALQKAVDADQKLVEALVYLGRLDVGKKQWEDAARNLDVAIQLDPVHFPDAWFNDAVAGFNLKNYDAAEKNVREAMKLDPQRKIPQSDYLLGLILAGKKDYSGAAEALRTYIKLSADAPDIPTAKAMLAQIEKLQTPSHP